MKSLGLTFVVGLFITIGNQALACECQYDQNAQQAAQGRHAIVAKVKTLKLEEHGTGELEVLETLKGRVADKVIKVQGGDGSNCFGTILPDKKNPWIVIMNKYDEGYYVASCADSSLEINPKTKKIKFAFDFDYDNGATNLTQKEFVKLINLKVLPTIHGLDCNVESGRFFTPGSGPDYQHPLDFGYDTQFSSEGLDKVTKEVDLSQETSDVSKLRINIIPKKLSRYKYQIDVGIKDPFFSQHEGFGDIVDIRERFDGNSASVFRYTDMDGKTVDHTYNGDQLYYNTSVRCSLRAGLPLVHID